MKPKSTVPNGRPILAVLVDSVKDTVPEPFGTIQAFSEELGKELNSRGWDCYIYPLPAFHPEKPIGYWHKESTFLLGEVPPPSIVYNRIHSRRTEAGNKFTSFTMWAEAHGIPVFNGRFLSKWMVHKMLENTPHLNAYIPDTCLFSRRNMHSMIKQHCTVFAKPIHGSKGRGIYQVSQTESGYEITPSIPEEKPACTVPDEEYLYQYFEKVNAGRGYLLQQGIQLLNWEGRNLDFRFLCHLGQDGEWKITSSTGRLAKKGQFAANLATGGDIIQTARVLQLLYGHKKQINIMDELADLALATAGAIGRNTPWLVAELGIDIAIDESGKLWLIEANSKPSKEYRSGSQPIRPSAVSIADCAQFLLNRNKEGETT